MSRSHEHISSWSQVEKRLDDIDIMLFRWKNGSMVKHIDIELFERLIHERFELDHQLMLATDVIQTLSNKLQAYELILQHFTPEDLRELRRRIETRLASEAKQSMEEVS